jgi:beta-N-acetylhexosaminidase
MLIASMLSGVVDGAAGATPTNLQCAVQVVSSWTLARQANETIVVSVNAMDLGGMVPAARAGFGGLLLLGSRAPLVIASTLGALQRMTPNHYQMMVMTDEEGGGVMRLNNLVGAFPWPQLMGRTMTPQQIGAVGQKVGAQLAAMGVNTDLAPVLDLDGRAVWPGPTNPDGMRSFGAAPLKTAVQGTAFMSGLTRAGVTSVVKHFPGLGGSSGNTDYGPATTKPWTILKSSALIPFEKAIAGGASAVMLSNAVVPGLSTVPASLSPQVVSELRNDLGFQGLITTDSLSAGAIGALHLSVAAATIRALQAGADQVLFNSSPTAAGSLLDAQSVSASVVAAVTSGALSRTSLIDAAAHVLATRNVLSCATTTS